MTERKAIYPVDSMSFDSLYATYARIAVEEYAKANSIYKRLEQTPADYDSVHEQFIQSSITSIVFAAMCIESFLNEYASACLGDEEFYSAFDKLSPEGKLMLIAKFLFSVSIDKSQKMYSFFRKLFKERNSYVHNKTTHCTYAEWSQCYSIEPVEEIEGDLEEYARRENEKFFRQQHKLDGEALTTVKNGILAVVELARFFDKHDQNANMVCRLFYPCIPKSIYESDTPYNNALRELKIK